MTSSIILVVDDERVITQTVVLILNNSGGGLFAIGSTDVDEALTIVHGIHLDLVLLDAVMPGVKGLQHALEMREKWGCKVLMMSGQGATADLLEEVVREGYEPFEILAKPVPPIQLIKKIQEMVQRPPHEPLWHNPLSFQIH